MNRAESANKRSTGRRSYRTRTIWRILLNYRAITSLIGSNRMKVLIYKRTHTGDPCECGIFGVGDCMGKIRSAWNYEAVIGVGGLRPWRRSKEIAGRLTWVGINRQKGDEKHKAKRGPVFTFKHFCLMNREGPLVAECAPRLWDHLKSRRSFVLDLSKSPPSTADIQYEVKALLDKYRRNSASISYSGECHCQVEDVCCNNSQHLSATLPRMPCG